MLQWRLEAFQRWKEMTEPTWAMVHYPKIDYQDAYYYAAPKGASKYKTIADVPQEILDTYAKLGIPLREQEVLLGVEGAMETAAAARETPRVAVDAVFDSISVATTFKAELSKAGVIFMSISEAIREYPDLVKQYLGSVFGRHLRLRAQGRALPDGAVHLFPHERQGHGPVRAHADHRG